MEESLTLATFANYYTLKSDELSHYCKLHACIKYTKVKVTSERKGQTYFIQDLDADNVLQ